MAALGTASTQESRQYFARAGGSSMRAWRIPARRLASSPLAPRRQPCARNPGHRSIRSADGRKSPQARAPRPIAARRRTPRARAHREGIGGDDPRSGPRGAQCQCDPGRIYRDAHLGRGRRGSAEEREQRQERRPVRGPRFCRQGSDEKWDDLAARVEHGQIAQIVAHGPLVNRQGQGNAVCRGFR